MAGITVTLQFFCEWNLNIGKERKFVKISEILWNTFKFVISNFPNPKWRAQDIFKSVHFPRSSLLQNKKNQLND